MKIVQRVSQIRSETRKCYRQNDGLTDEGHSSAWDEVGVSFDRSSLVFETATEFCFQMTSVTTTTTLVKC